MAIKLTCDCGRRFTVPDGTEGRETFCPECRTVLRVSDGKRAKDGEKTEKRREKKSDKAKERREKSPASVDSGAPAAGKEEKEEKDERARADGSGEGETSAESLFREAIAAFEEVYEGPAGEVGEGSSTDGVARAPAPPVRDAQAEEPPAEGASAEAASVEAAPAGDGKDGDGKEREERKEREEPKERGERKEREEEEEGEEGGERKEGKERKERVAAAVKGDAEGDVEGDAEGDGAGPPLADEADDSPSEEAAAPPEPEVAEADRRGSTDKRRSTDKRSVKGTPLKERDDEPAPPPRDPSAEGEGKGGPKSRDAMPVEAALDMLERKDLERAIRREGEPESPAGAHQPKDVELHGSVMKFHCRCGKRISVPVKAKKTIGRCPKCGARVVIPKASAAKPAGSGPEEPPAAAGRKPPGGGKRPRRSHEARSKKARAAAADVADRLRKGKAAKKPSKAASKAPSKAAEPPSWVARVVAVQVDAAVLAAAFFGALFLLRGIGLHGASLAGAAAFAAGVWVSNRVLLQWADGASFGMKPAGLRLTTLEGGRASFGATVLRALLGAVLLPLAPLALRDLERRTPADRAAGTAIVARDA